MKEEYMRFGTFLRTKRLNDPRGVTLKQLADVLGISLSLLSDIEQCRRKPLESNRIEIVCDYLHLNDTDKALMYDLAARENGDIPSDLDELMMYTEVGKMARRAMRLTNAGVADEEDWKRFIRELESKGRGDKK